MKVILKCVAALAVLGGSAWSTTTHAQDNGWTGGTGNWNDTTWEFSGPPLLNVDGRGVIGSNAGSNSPIGDVSVTSNIGSAPAVLLGDGTGTSGTLHITSAGTITVATGDGSNGNLSVGAGGGLGVLNVMGRLDVEGELESRNTADEASTINLTGSANVTSVSGFMDRQFIVDGSNVSANFSNRLVLGSSGTHTWRIPPSGASTILVSGNADLGGTLKVEFPGSTPTLGSTWNLIDSRAVDDGESPATGFNRIDQSAVSGLVEGLKFAVNSVASAGSLNGVYTQLALEQHPVLVIDRQTGAVTMQNFNGSAATESFDAYIVGSGGGNLNPTAWNGFAPSIGWQAAAATSQALSELNPVDTDSLMLFTTRSLGTPFAAPSSFGDVTDDITFRFAKSGQSIFTDGSVIYTGPSNSTLTLNVDPSTGQAQIINATAFTVSIDTYAITSESDSLDTSWNSLEDQGTTGGNWHEANVSTGQLAELLSSGGMVLAPGAVISLGSAFNDVSGSEDLVFQFAQYSDGGGDFDGDGDVDGADFLRWQRSGSPNPGSPADLAAWESNYGAEILAGDFQAGDVLYGRLVGTTVGVATAVPEPSTAAMLLVLLSIAAVSKRS